MAERGDDVKAEDRASPGTSTTRGRYAKVGLSLMAIGAGLLVTVLAVQQLRTGGTDVAGPLTIANYEARAKVEDEPAPPFELPALEGAGTIGLDDFAGDVVVLNFWASWCGPCRAEAPHLQATWEAYREHGVRFLGVDYRDDRAAARAFVGEFGLTYPSVFDPAGELAFEYGLIGLPTTVIVTPERRIAYRFVGKIDGAILRDALEDVLSRSGA